MVDSKNSYGSVKLFLALPITIINSYQKYAHIAQPINQLVSGENANKKKTLVE